MKKVLLSAYACSPHKGSEYCVGWSWAFGLAQKGYQVWCCTNTEDWEDCEKERALLGLENLHFVPVALKFGLDRYLLDNSSNTIYLHYHLWKRKAANVLKKLHLEIGFDISHHVSYGSFQQGSPLYKLEGCKLIFGPVGGGQMTLPIFRPFFKGTWYMERLRKLTSKLYMKFNPALNQTLEKASVVLTVNKETEELLKNSKYYKPKTAHFVSDSALPKQFEGNVYNKKEREGELRILWIGRIIPRRGLELSLRALSHLPDDLPYKFVIVGDGKQGKKLKGWIAKYNLNRSRIEHLGWVPYTQVHKEYEKADMMLFCPLRDTSGLQAIEAMSFGLPIITLNISGMRTIIPENCCLKINPTTAEGTTMAIANGITKVYKDEGYRKRISKNAYAFAISATWEAKINKVTKTFY